MRKIAILGVAFEIIGWCACLFGDRPGITLHKKVISKLPCRKFPRKNSPKRVAPSQKRRNFFLAISKIKIQLSIFSLCLLI